MNTNPTLPNSLPTEEPTRFTQHIAPTTSPLGLYRESHLQEGMAVLQGLSYSPSKKTIAAILAYARDGKKG